MTEAQEAVFLAPAQALQIAAQVVARCRAIASITDVPGETTRTFLSGAMRRANVQVTAWMREAGLTVHTDDAGTCMA